MAAEPEGARRLAERGNKGAQNRDDGSHSETSQRASAGALRCWSSMPLEEEKVKDSNGFGFSGRTVVMRNKKDTVQANTLPIPPLPLAAS